MTRPRSQLVSLDGTGSLGITDTQWLTLALEIQQQSILMLNGLDTLVRIERHEIRAAVKAA